MTDTQIKVGATGRSEHAVEERHCTQRGTYRIFSTPNMVQLLEWAAIDALKPFLANDQISVGSTVNVRHQAPTPLGGKVRAEAVIQEVDGARIVFDVALFDDQEKIGAATHERYVLDFERYIRRIEKKITASAISTPGIDAA